MPRPPPGGTCIQGWASWEKAPLPTHYHIGTVLSPNPPQTGAAHPATAGRNAHEALPDAVRWGPALHAAGSCTIRRFPSVSRDASARIAGTIKAGSAPRHMAHTGARRLIARLQRQALLRFKYGHRRPVFRLLHCKQPVPVRLYMRIDQLRTHIPAAEPLSIELQGIDPITGLSAGIGRSKQTGISSYPSFLLRFLITDSSHSLFPPLS